MDERIDSRELYSLKQRIAFRCRLQPLTWGETQEYVNWRLKRSGANGECPFFSVDTLRTIHQYSRGCPRLINIICENTLISAYAAGTCHSSVQLVEEACDDLRISVDLPTGNNQGVQPKSPHRSVGSTSEEPLENLADRPRTATRPRYESSNHNPEENS